jgi:hypothetical protein
VINKSKVILSFLLGAFLAVIAMTTYTHYFMNRVYETDQAAFVVLPKNHDVVCMLKNGTLESLFGKGFTRSTLHSTLSAVYPRKTGFGSFIDGDFVPCSDATLSYNYSIWGRDSVATFLLLDSSGPKFYSATIFLGAKRIEFKEFKRKDWTVTYLRDGSIKN